MILPEWKVLYDTAMITGLNPKLPSLEQLHKKFFNAKPFRHICIDDFLDPDLAQALLDQFPKFDTERAKNEFGHVGGKATQERVLGLGDAYVIADELVKNADFLTFLSSMTGIRDLEYDPSYFGGGTHENRHGQELDPHVDFNRDAESGKYRRLNLLVYLNKDWEESWGGQIEIHSNPRVPEENQIISFLPVFNRCVIFETHESSWHGFPRINLPEEKQHLSRKSFSVYFYSKHAPECGETPLHATFYVQRWLPDTIKAGQVLSEGELFEIKALLKKRDHWIQYYQNKEIEFSRERDHYKKIIASLEQSGGPKLLGYAAHSKKPIDWYTDGWCGPEAVFTLKIERPVTQITLNAFIPPGTIRNNELKIQINGDLQGEIYVESGKMVPIKLPVNLFSSEIVELQISSKNSFIPAKIGMGDDPRKLSWILADITIEHS